MNELLPQQLDQTLFNQPPVEQRKPLRQFVDDKMMPNIGNVVGPPLALISALSNIQRTPRIVDV